MNGSTAKQVRRDLRRAMGPQALDLVGRQAQAITAQQVRLERTTVEIDVLLARIDARVTRLEQHIRQTWRGRLRWLLTGR